MFGRKNSRKVTAFVTEISILARRIFPEKTLQGYVIDTQPFIVFERASRRQKSMLYLRSGEFRWRKDKMTLYFWH